MQPKFIEFPQTKVVGLGAKFISILSPDKTNFNVIPELWHRFVQQLPAIKNRVGQASYGLVEPLPQSEPKSHKAEMFYIAAVPVRDFDSIPPGMLQRTIPAGRHAVFTHKGKLDNLQQTMDAIYGQWVPESKTQLREAPHLELYDQRFIPDSDDSEFDILLPVR